MKKVMVMVFLLGLLLPMLLFQAAGEATLIFDADLSFNPQAGKRFHYWMMNLLLGFETRWADRNFIGGVINTTYYDIINGSGNGVVDGTIEFSIYESYDFSNTLEGENPGGSGGGMSPGWSMDPPFSLEGGHLVPNEPPDAYGTPPGGFGPLQGALDPGDVGGDGDFGGNRESFHFTPIFENNIGYSLSSTGKVLNVRGLEQIGDITDPTFAQAEELFDPARSISLRQIFQVSHFLVLPDYTLHVGDTWKAPFHWNAPLIGKPIKIMLTYTLEDIKTYYRFKCARISYIGLTDIEMDFVDENYTRRRESHVEGDIIMFGTIFFDIDRGMIVAMKDASSFGGSQQNQYLDFSQRHFGGFNWGFLALLSFDRIDLITPLGNVIDPRTEKDHVLQDFVWRTDMIME